MSRPRRATAEAFYDVFADFTLEDQKIALRILEQTHRLAERAHARSSAESKAAPAAHCIDKGLSDSPAPGAVQPIQTLFDGAAPKPAKAIP